MNWPTGVVNNKSNKHTAVQMERDSDRQRERERVRSKETDIKLIM